MAARLTLGCPLCSFRSSRDRCIPEEVPPIGARNARDVVRRTVRLRDVAETSRRGILGRHQSCDSKGIDILSDSIECNHPSRSTSSLLYSKSCEIEDWRSSTREIIHVSSTTTKDLITTRSRLDQRESSIGFYS